MEYVDISLDQIDSTNTYAKQHGAEFDPDKVTCITAEEQTGGRGRYQRTWVSPRGVNLYVTFSFLLPRETPHLISLGQVMTCSLASLLLSAGLAPKIKWPNDVQLAGKKVSGVLCETVFGRTAVQVIVGIGINVNMGKEDLDTIDQSATSLKNETGHSWERKSLLQKLKKQFLSDLEAFKVGGFGPFYPLFNRLLAFKGQTIRCFDGQKEWVGICHSITPEGQLNLLLPDQTLHTLSSGDVNAL